MTLADTARPAFDPASALPSRRRARRLVVGASIVLLLVAGGTTAYTYYYDSVPLVENTVSYPVVPVSELSPLVANAFIAAVDPDFYVADDSLITRRYTSIASGSGEESGWRTRILVNKAEARYTKTEILDGYLNSADYGRGAVGLVAAARTYFDKPAAQLTVAEAARLAVQLDPDRRAPEAGWNQVLDTMVERGWLGAPERNQLVFPG
jgi:membrane peptidoglycan carboxypeptidase